MARRRDMVKGSVAGLVAIAGFSGVSAASDPEAEKSRKRDISWKDFEKRLKSEYGQEEAAVATDMAKNAVKSVRRGTPRKKAHTELHDKILNSPKTSEIAADIRDVQRSEEKHEHAIQNGENQ